jgi:phenylpropionate dioxygenase-like ring-hydroxylating dioxygenase large terminal subunit
VPEDQDFKHKVKAKAYRAVERAGLVWVHMGEGEPASMPGFEVLDLPPDEINVHIMQRRCNWLQALEGEIDTAHFGFLHAGHVDPADVPETDPFYFTITNRAPQYHVADAPWGTQYAGYRAAGPGQTYWRFANFLFPCWSQAPNGEFESHMHARAWVPLDDGHTMFFFIWWKKAKSAQALPQPRYKDGSPIGGTGRGGIKMLPNTTDWLGRWRLAQDEGNDWGMDRDKQRRNEIYSGIDGVHLQDQAITESMGPVTDFGHEHLAPSDQMITRTRRRLLLAARALRDKGERPPGADDPDVYRGARSGYFVKPDDGSAWHEVYAKTLVAAVHPLRAAE